MYAITIEVGPELGKLLVPIVTAAAAALAAWSGTRFVRKEMKNNGGSSMRDAVDRTEEHSADAAGKLDELLARVNALESVDQRSSRLQAAWQQTDANDLRDVLEQVRTLPPPPPPG